MEDAFIVSLYGTCMYFWSWYEKYEQILMFYIAREEQWGDGYIKQHDGGAHVTVHNYNSTHYISQIYTIFVFHTSIKLKKHQDQWSMRKHLML
jgi:hypothetical protein